MEILSTIFFFLIAIFVLVTVHEFGHFAAAKLCGMRVERFFIGFDFWDLKVWSVQRGETEYGIGAIPLGGYVKISGMVDESMDTDFSNKPAEPWEFRAKPTWQKLFVLVGGVLMNMILALFIFIGIALFYGDPKTPIRSGVFILENTVFSEMGLQTGDEIKAINGKSVKYWEEVMDPSALSSSELTYTVLRNGELRTFVAPDNILSRLSENPGVGLVPLLPPTISEVAEGMPAKAAGLQKGDVIIGINGEKIANWSQVQSTVGSNANKPLTLDVKRGESQIQLTVTANSDGRIGIASDQSLRNREFTELSFFGAIGSGFDQTFKMTATTVKGFWKILTGKEELSKSVGGPVKIAKMANDSASQGAGVFVYFLALLSISLAFMNILPLPALDGGQMVMVSIEGLLRRELSLKVKIAVQQAGMTVLLILMVFILYNDIAHP
ncbi:MAG: RIP metalloprotease RseP [Chloroherpetonaceae bacterium]|nr:RIP metalloprotease RseP [Chloroherpetonaceae bacterium]